MTYPDPFYGQTPGTSYYGKMGGAAMDPLAIAGGVGSALSGVFGQQGMSGNVQKHLAREGLNQSAAPIAADLSTRLATMPLADRAAFLLSQRLSPGVMAGNSFTPHDLFNPGASADTPQYSGVNQEALAGANAGYQPGQGGFDPGVLRQALARLNSSGARGFETTAGAGTPWGDQTFIEQRPGIMQDVLDKIGDPGKDKAAERMRRVTSRIFG